MFGVNIDHADFLHKYLKVLPKLGQVDAQIVLGDLYDKEYGIFDHSDKTSQRPLSSVALHPPEIINDDSILVEAMRLYASRSVYEYFRISFTDFMELPRDVAQLMLKVCKEYMDKKTKTMEELEERLNNINNPTA